MSKGQHFLQFAQSLFPQGKGTVTRGTPHFYFEAYGREIGLHYRADDNAVTIDFNWLKDATPQNPINPDSSFQRGQSLQPGTTDLLRMLKKLALDLKQNGYRVIAVGADQKLDDFYQKSLNKLGFTQQKFRPDLHENKLNFKEFFRNWESAQGVEP